MTKIKYFLFIGLFIGSVHTIYAQNFYLTPTIGIKADVNHPNEKYQLSSKQNDYFQFTYPKVSFTGISPLLFGLNLEYKQNKNIFGLGIIVGDQANSTIRVSFNQTVNNPYVNNRFTKKYGNYAGWPIYAKIPLIYKREIFSVESKKDKEKTRLAINLNTGVNLMFLKVKGEPRFRNPISFGATNTDFGDSIDFVGVEGHMNRSFSISFNLGLDFDFYVHGKRRIVAQLYYEQGTRYISNATYFMYLNNAPWGNVGSMSRGSAINFKLAFPINVCNITKNKDQE